MGARRLLLRHVALPGDHGSWVFLLSPLLIGLFAGGRFRTVSVYLIVAALAGFLVRQPITIAVKALSGRRSRNDLQAAAFWFAVYAGVGSLHVLGLTLRGFGYLLYLALPGIPALAWYLHLVRNRSERRQFLVELLAIGVLALSAPAGLWVGEGRPDPVGWLLWGLTWFHGAASIVYTYLRLEQRQMKSIPGLAVRMRMGAPALAFTGFNLAVVLGSSLYGSLPRWLFIPYALRFGEALSGTLRPALGFRPTRIGYRQVIASAVFTTLFILAWRL